MIFDCCYAEAVADLFRIALDDDAHVEWHAQLCSSRRNQMSRFNEEANESAFINLLVSALKGGTERPCPYNCIECEICLNFKSCSESGYIGLRDIEDFVGKHLPLRQNDKWADSREMQVPVLTGIRENHNPRIAYFNSKPKLYSFVLESMHNSECREYHEFQTDDLSALKIFDMTVDYHPKDACRLTVFKRDKRGTELKRLGRCYPHSGDMPENGCHNILIAVSEDSGCLVVVTDDVDLSVEVTESSSGSSSQTSQ